MYLTMEVLMPTNQVYLLGISGDIDDDDDDVFFSDTVDFFFFFRKDYLYVLMGVKILLMMWVSMMEPTYHFCKIVIVGAVGY